MLCKICKTNMIYIRENSIQGLACPSCGWRIITTYIDETNQDITEYSLFTKKVQNIDINKIKVISQIAGVNYLVARQILENDDICILKAKALDIKSAISELNNVNISFDVVPEFRYK